MRDHIWTAFLNPIDRPPTSSTFFRTTLLSPSFHLKPLHYSFHPLLIHIFMLLLISGDIHPNPGAIDPCSVCSRRVTWETDRYNVPTVLFGYTSPALVFLLLTFVKSHRDTLGLAQCVHPLLNLSPLSHTLILYLYPSLYLHPLTHQIPHPHSQTTTKPYLQKLTPPKITTNNPTNPLNHPQLIYTYPPSASSIPPPQTQHTISPLTQSSFHPSSPSQNNLRILQ